MRRLAVALLLLAPNGAASEPAQDPLTVEVRNQSLARLPYVELTVAVRDARGPVANLDKDRFTLALGSETLRRLEAVSVDRIEDDDRPTLYVGVLFNTYRYRKATDNADRIEGRDIPGVLDDWVKNSRKHGTRLYAKSSSCPKGASQTYADTPAGFTLPNDRIGDYAPVYAGLADLGDATKKARGPRDAVHIVIASERDLLEPPEKPLEKYGWPSGVPVHTIAFGTASRHHDIRPLEELSKRTGGTHSRCIDRKELLRKIQDIVDGARAALSGQYELTFSTSDCFPGRARREGSLTVAQVKPERSAKTSVTVAIDEAALRKLWEQFVSRQVAAAKKHADEGAFAKAREDLAPVLADEPERREAVDLLKRIGEGERDSRLDQARALHKAGKDEEARKIVEDLRRDAPGTAGLDALYFEIRLALASESLRQAKAEKVEANRHQLLKGVIVRLEELRTERRDEPELISALAAAFLEVGHLYVQWAREGKAEFLEGYLQLAIEQYSRSAELAPGDEAYDGIAASAVRRADLLAGLGKLKQARESLVEAQKLLPDAKRREKLDRKHTELLFRSVDSSTTDEETLKLFTELLSKGDRLDPRNEFVAWKGVCKLLLDAKSWEECIRSGEAARKLDDKDPDVRACLGKAYLERGRILRGEKKTEEAVRALQTSVARHATLPGYQTLGETAREAFLFALAAEAFRWVYDHKDSSVDYNRLLSNLVESHFGCGDFSRCVRYLRERIADKPDEEVLWDYLVLALKSARYQTLIQALAAGLPAVERKLWRDILKPVAGRGDVIYLTLVDGNGKCAYSLRKAQEDRAYSEVAPGVPTNLPPGLQGGFVCKTGDDTMEAHLLIPLRRGAREWLAIGFGLTLGADARFELKSLRKDPARPELWSSLDRLVASEIYVELCQTVGYAAELQSDVARDVEPMAARMLESADVAYVIVSTGSKPRSWPNSVPSSILDHSKANNAAAFYQWDLDYPTADFDLEGGGKGKGWKVREFVVPLYPGDSGADGALRIAIRMEPIKR